MNKTHDPKMKYHVDFNCQHVASCWEDKLLCCSRYAPDNVFGSYEEAHNALVKHDYLLTKHWHHLETD